MNRIVIIIQQKIICPNAFNQSNLIIIWFEIFLMLIFLIQVNVRLNSIDFTFFLLEVYNFTIKY